MNLVCVYSPRNERRNGIYVQRLNPIKGGEWCISTFSFRGEGYWRDPLLEKHNLRPEGRSWSEPLNNKGGNAELATRRPTFKLLTALLLSYCVGGSWISL